MGRVLLTVIRLGGGGGGEGGRGGGEGIGGRGILMYRWTAYNAVYPNGRITETFLGCVWMNIEVQAAAMRRGGG